MVSLDPRKASLALVWPQWRWHGGRHEDCSGINAAAVSAAPAQQTLFAQNQCCRRSPARSCGGVRRALRCGACATERACNGPLTVTALSLASPSRGRPRAPGFLLPPMRADLSWSYLASSAEQRTRWVVLGIADAVAASHRRRRSMLAGACWPKEKCSCGPLRLLYRRFGMLLAAAPGEFSQTPMVFPSRRRSAATGNRNRSPT